MTRIIDLLHKQNPYIDFSAEEYSLDLQGWGSEAPIFEDVIRQLRPSRILEIGSWKGASAIHMALLTQKYQIPDVEIVCVDTWLGSPNVWIDGPASPYYSSLMLVNGFPSIYYQFIANIIKSGVKDLVTPFPSTSSAAASFFAAKGLHFDAIYIDASHEYRDVRQDLELYWSALQPGGVLFGDDFVPAWGGVVRAVSEWSEVIGRKISIAPEGKWLIQK